MLDLPHAVSEVVDLLAKVRGVVAVALGGSRAVGSLATGADWDLGVYYRGLLDLDQLAVLGTIHPPGAWGRIMNGGAWLTVGGEKVDVLLRDLDVVEYWTERAMNGEFEVDALLGYVAGVPTYTLMGELASCRVLHGDLPSVSYPTRLAASAPARWRFSRTFSLDYARAHARQRHIVGAVAQTAKAVFEEAHAIACERGRWVCNEKRLIDAAELGAVHGLFAELPTDSAELFRWIDRIAAGVGASPHDAAPWLRPVGM